MNKKSESDKKLKVLVGICFLLVISVSFLSLSQYNYILPGDSVFHWKHTSEIQREKKIIYHNAFFPEAPLWYPYGYHVVFAVISNITDLNLNLIFLYTPLIFYMFYFSVIYFFVKRLTNNTLIGLLSAFSILFFWVGYPGYRIFFYLWATPRMITPFIIILVMSLLFYFKKISWIIIALLSFTIGIFHRSTAIVFFIFLFIYAGLKFLKKCSIKMPLIAIFFLFISASIWSMPYLINHGIPFSDLKGNMLPRTENINTETHELTLIENINKGINPFIEPFLLKEKVPMLLAWFLFSIFGFFIFIRRYRGFEASLVFSLFLLLALINSFFLNIEIINDMMRYLLVPFLFCIFFGVGIYHILIENQSNIKKVTMILLLLIMISSTLVVASNLYFERLDSPKYLQISKDAINFLKNTPENSTIFADSMSSYYFAHLTGRKVYTSQEGHLGPLYGLNYSLRKINREIIMTSCNINETREILNNNYPAYVYIGWLENAKYDVCLEKFEKYFEVEDFVLDKVYYLKGEFP